jgi:SAM-dependent methyltransferase
MGLQAGNSVLDICCGPGRLSVLAALKGCTVTGIDSSPAMLELARANAAEFGVADACDFRLMDWNNVMPGQNLSCADLVIASRCSAMMDIEKLSALSKHRVGIQIFADAPSIPELQDVFFAGCPKPGLPAERPGRPPHGPADAQGQPPRPGRIPGAYKTIFDKAYAAGYDPDVRILPERFRRTFASEEEAVAWVCKLRPAVARGHEDLVSRNVAPFLAEKGDGVELCIATTAAIISWDVRGRAGYFGWR